MIGLDTNILVRYLKRDDPAQAARAAALIEAAFNDREELFVSHIVLCELVWVLQSGYRHSKAEVVKALRLLLSATQLVFEDVDQVRRALARLDAGGGGFADYLIGERAVSAGCGRVATFDRALLADPAFFSP